MADREAQQKLYAYSEMSNKVHQADRSSRRSRGFGSGADGTGEVESLRGRSDVGRMGDRIVGVGVGAPAAGNEVEEGSGKKMRPAELEEMMERANKKRRKREGHPAGVSASGGAGGDKLHKQNILMSSGGRSILDMGELSGYQPTHAGSRSSYESLLVRRIKGWHRMNLYSVSCHTCVSFGLESLCSTHILPILQ
jgi:hypothetical protein